MPWTDQALAGFTQGKPWLPIPAEHRALSVQAQEADGDSTLQAFRSFLRWRKAHPALVEGTIRFLDSTEPVLLFERQAGDETLLLAFNLSGDTVRHALPAGEWQALALPGPVAGALEAGELVLAGNAVYCARRS
jgi:alpha-glucosidase